MRMPVAGSEEETQPGKEAVACHRLVGGAGGRDQACVAVNRRWCIQA